MRKERRLKLNCIAFADLPTSPRGESTEPEWKVLFSAYELTDSFPSSMIECHFVVVTSEKGKGR